jgi:uncharacterized protein (DUF1800 family)
MPRHPSANPTHPVAAILLALLLPSQTLPAQPNQKQSLPARPAQLGPDQRVLHLLSRFTFGPTPDDIAAVRGMGASSGIDKWFELQLHPDRLPITSGDELLSARLADYPALQLPVDQILERFPNGAAIRQASVGKREIPSDPVIAAIYRRHIDLYEAKQAAKNEAIKDASMAKPEMMKPDTRTVNSKPNSPTAKMELLAKTVLNLPPDARVSRILAMQPAEYDEFRSSLKPPQKTQLTQDLTSQQRELLSDFDNPTRTVVEELQSQRLLRDIYSSHQLQEVMTTFWLNHFNIYIHKNEETPYYLVSYERDVIRPRALGNFEDLLVATAESPAMLLYLDNNTSTGPNSPAAEKQKQRAAQGKQAKATPPGLNENYARELMELHTLGVNGGYTQKDVTEVAKVFTGWTVGRKNSPSAQAGQFQFDETRHEPGIKRVLSRKIKEDGEKEGLQLLHTLATRPATAHFISQELATAFVSDTPPKTLVDRMAQSFLKTSGDIPSVLRTMVKSPEFWAPSAYQAKVKTPLEYVVSAARASGAEITNTQPLINQLNQMGMPLYACIPPTGYSSKADAWVSTGELVTRMNFSLSLATNHYPGIKADWAITPNQTTTPAEAEQQLEARLIPTGISDKTRTAILAQAQDPPKPPAQPQKPVPVASKMPVVAVSPNPGAQKAAATQAAALDKNTQQSAQLAALLLGSPEFQRR